MARRELLDGYGKHRGSGNAVHYFPTRGPTNKHTNKRYLVLGSLSAGSLGHQCSNTLTFAPTIKIKIRYCSLVVALLVDDESGAPVLLMRITSSSVVSLRIWRGLHDVQPERQDDTRRTTLRVSPDGELRSRPGEIRNSRVLAFVRRRLGA